MTGLRRFRYICTNSHEMNYDMYLDPQQVYQWPQPLQPMSDYILSNEFVSLTLVLHRDIFQVEYEDQPVQQPESEPPPYVDASWANWKDSKNARSQPKDEIGEQLEWQSKQQAEEHDYSSHVKPHYQE